MDQQSQDAWSLGVYNVFFSRIQAKISELVEKGQVNRMKWKRLRCVDVSLGWCLCFSQVAKCSNRRLCWRSCRVPCLQLPRGLPVRMLFAGHLPCQVTSLQTMVATSRPGLRDSAENHVNQVIPLPSPGRFSSRPNRPPLPSKKGCL